MGVIVVNTDFNSGKYHIAQATHSSASIDSFIDEFEKVTLYKLLGKELGDLLIADLDVNKVPQTAKYQKIFNALQVDTDWGIISSKGIKEILKAKIWFEWMSVQPAKNTPSGNVQNKSDISDSLDFGIVYNKYNDSMGWWDAVQWYVLYNEDSNSYPEYNGYDFELQHWSL